RHLAYDDPTNMLAAKFSIPYSVAAAVVLRDTGVDAFRNPALEDPSIRELARRVTVHETADWTYQSGAPRVTRIDVHLKNGDVLHGETRFVRGDAANPVDRSVILEKFRYLAGHRSGDATVRAIEDRVLHIDEVDDVSSLHEILAGGA